MPTLHTVVQGECMNSIALQYGWFADTLWDHADNAELKRLRGDPDTLFPRDVVVIPDIRPKTFGKPTDQRHVFRRKGVPRKLVLHFRNGDLPLANLRYMMSIDGVLQDGATDADGTIVVYISPAARLAEVRFEDGEEYEIELGTMDPLDEVSGVQKRLANLGFYSGEPDGQLREATVTALNDFQAAYGLEVSGAPDAATRAKLQEIAGS